MNSTDHAIYEVLNAYRAAVLAKDIDAFVALYADDVTVFDLWGTWCIDGIAGWREMASCWFGGLGDERVAVDFSAVKTQAAPGLAVVHAFAKFTALDAADKELRSLDNRVTMTLQARGGRWQIVHEHTSAPIDHASAKAMLQR